MRERIDRILYDRGTEIAIEVALAEHDVAAAVGVLDEIMRDLYWKKKDLDSTVKVGLAAARHAIKSADAIASEQHDLADKLRGMAKTLYYNVASMTWRGWDETDISMTSRYESMGLDAAYENLRLGIELRRGHLPMSRAYWMLGAQQISARDYREARASFDTAANNARLAEESCDELLCNAFALLADFLADPADLRLDPLVRTVRELTKVKDGDFFARQVVTAMNVFHPQCKRLDELAAAAALQLFRRLSR